MEEGREREIRVHVAARALVRYGESSVLQGSDERLVVALQAIGDGISSRIAVQNDDIDIRKFLARS